MNRYRVPFTRTVTQSIAIIVEAPTSRDAMVKAAVELNRGQAWDVGEPNEPRVGKVERVAEPRGDPLAIPVGLQRTA